jgi:hypothetical protein
VLATSQDAIQLDYREFKTREMTRQALSISPYRDVAVAAGVGADCLLIRVVIEHRARCREVTPHSRAIDNKHSTDIGA